MERIALAVVGLLVTVAILSVRIEQQSLVMKRSQRT